MNLIGAQFLPCICPRTDPVPQVTLEELDSAFGRHHLPDRRGRGVFGQAWCRPTRCPKLRALIRNGWRLSPSRTGSMSNCSATAGEDG